MTEYFPQAPMLPYYKYSGQGNLFAPRGYAQGTLVDLLSSRKTTNTTGDMPLNLMPPDDVSESDQPTFEEVKDSGTQSFFNGMDVNEGDNLSFDDLSDLSLTDGLFGGITVSGNAPKGWNTQHQREFDALVAAGLRPSAKWTGNDWYVFAKALDGTPFGEPGTMSLADSYTSKGKYDGQAAGILGLAQAVTGSFKADEVFQKNLAEALDTFSNEEFTELQRNSFGSKKAVSSAGTVTAKRGGAIKTVKPTEKTKTQSKSLKEIITSAFETSKKKEENDRSEEIEKNKEKQADARKAVKDIKTRSTRFTRGGYGF